MRFTKRTIGLAATLALGLTGIGATAAQAADGGPATHAPSALVLTIANGTNPNTATVERAVTLRCSPAVGGDHPDAYQACAELGAVGGDFAELSTNSPHGICPMIWMPVTVSAQGVWNGQRISYSHTYANECVMKTNNAYVFSF
ncbi:MULTISPECIES: subtilase-type protease inhibitor [Streptomyces]|uniref:Subtilase-type protease inhibitor n=1 Tax=Streptomyces silvisoli TaxID=3034235 RepID=A0ABT5ZH36_9ACTN|nr:MULTISPECIES: subtilase-type protease inhibitor [Streptomyces]MDF3289141.1 subtilase-type protease inhibitor [Streptomyces silvisoli]